MDQASATSQPTISSKESIILIGIMLFGMYTALALPLGNLYLPFIILLAVTAYLVLFRFHLLRSTDALFLAAGFVILTLNSLLSPAGLDFLVDKYKAIFQIMCGLILGVFMARIVPSVNLQSLSKLLLGSCGLIIVLAILERAGVTREISNAWREMVYTGTYTNAYVNDTRDLRMTGFIRPKVFTAEPAFVANYLFVTLSATALITRRLATAVATVLMGMAGFLLVGSPICILACLSAGVVTVLRFSRYAHWMVIGGALSLFILLTTPLPDGLTDKFERVQERFAPLIDGNFDHITEGSLRSRIYVPFWLAAPTAIKENPFFGVGVGGKEYLSKRIIPGFSSKGQEIGSHEQTLGTNALGNMIATLGILGFTMLGAALFFYMQHNYTAQSYIFLIPAGLLLFCRGAYETQAFWLSIFLMLAIDQQVNAKAKETETETVDTKSKQLLAQ